MKIVATEETLVIAEKPSVAQDIVRALTPVSGKFDKAENISRTRRYVVTSAVGHLVEIQAPSSSTSSAAKWSFAHLPVIPPHFDLKPLDKTKSRLNADGAPRPSARMSALVNACDAGREGELIFRLIQQYARGQLPGKPVQRLWLQSMTPQAIRDGFESLRSDQPDAGPGRGRRCRLRGRLAGGHQRHARDDGLQLARWRLLPDHRGPRADAHACPSSSSARKRSAVSSAATTGKCTRTFGAQAGEYPASGSTRLEEEARPDGDDAEKRADRLWNRGPGRRRRRARPAGHRDGEQATTQASPLLFDLTSLQREANGRFGFSAKNHAGDGAGLYERHKALTYPRTDSRALPEDYLPVARQTF